MAKYRVLLLLYILCLVICCYGTAASKRHKHNKQSRRFLIGHSSTNSGNGSSSAAPHGAAGAGAWPSVFNLATKARIEANATCGQDGREEYCREHGPSRSRQAQCGICDEHSPDPNKRHPVQYAIDGNNDHWWQSPSLALGEEYESVTVTLDLGQEYEISYVILRAGPSSRPAAWALERSRDEEGEDFEVWQYFARGGPECSQLWGSSLTAGRPKAAQGPPPICTAFFSKAQPHDSGEIHVSLGGGGSGQEWSRARAVRVRLAGLHGGSHAARRYYTLRDVTVGGRCSCRGHAHHCRHNVARGHPECECIHHTCGSNCNYCCPMYNQMPFLPGTASEANICQPCQCHGHATECRYDAEVDKLGKSIDTHGRYKGGGVCINCQRHTKGINCEKCEDGYYRPPEILPNDEEPCKSCNCDLVGSTGNCIYNDFEDAILCECKEGYSGFKCNKCDIGYKGFPDCHTCPCDKAGTLINEDCTGECQCKVNVEGKYCESCKKGFFSINALNPEGCLPCYCSGLSQICQSVMIENHVFQILNGWMVTDMTISIMVSPSIDTDTGRLTIGNDEIPDVESYYWSAPDMYLGNKLKAYGSQLIFRVGWVVIRGDTSGKPTTGPNVIIYGHNGLKIGYGDISYSQSDNDIEVSIPLQEDRWFHILPTVKDIITRPKRNEYKGDMVTRAQFMSIMTSIRHILVRSKFHTDQIEGSLEEVLILIGNGKAEAYISSVEKCSCPPGFTGFSCEHCAFGYVRVFTNSTSHMEQFECIKCDCNGHAETCNLATGKCSTCEHNTMGEKCERCVSGYYGNPMVGLWDDCKPCACPLLEDSNNFSPSCALDGSGSNTYFCSQCPEGYTGDHCEICDYGYFGDPTTLGSLCEPCSCNGAPCNGTTGQCLSCPGNTEGFKCERCKEDHYGIASEKDCKPCDCDIIGAESTTCDPNSGQCYCSDRYAGRSCNVCKEGYGNITSGCIPCTCNNIGSVSPVCDSITGHCNCQPGVEGFRCDECQYLHYGFSEDGCFGDYEMAVPAVDSSGRILGRCVLVLLGLLAAGGLVLALTPSALALAPAPPGPIHGRGPEVASTLRRTRRAAHSAGSASRVKHYNYHRRLVNSIDDLSSPQPQRRLRDPTPDKNAQPIRSAPSHTQQTNERSHRHDRGGVDSEHTRSNQNVGKQPQRKLRHSRRHRRPHQGTHEKNSIAPSVATKLDPKQPLDADLSRRKRYPYIDSNTGKVLYYVDCCEYPYYECYLPVDPVTPRVRPSYGPHSKDWKGLIHGCNCHEQGSELKSCDIKTGQCRCRQNVVGLTCDQCAGGYWGLHSGRGCQRCDCDPTGGAEGGCHPHSGACRCRPGVGGPACDSCLPGHYGFSATGCIKCEVCSPGQICDPDTGRCICPALSQGISCRECRSGAWGLVPFKGCKYCNCSSVGSTYSQCNPIDGSCECREGFSGSRCDRCAPLYFGYPRCRPCNCHYEGTVPGACDANDHCQCDEHGQCPCKANVMGHKCTECRPETFGLTNDNPVGCSKCFCFGRSTQCSQGALTWGHIRLHSPRILQLRSDREPKLYGPPINFVSINKIGELPLDYYSEDQDLDLKVVSGITVIPDTEGNITIGINRDLPYPLYWELPKRFLGDRVTSYGGYLKFFAESTGLTDKISYSVLKQYSLVQLHAQGIFVLEYHEKYPAENGLHEVKFHESLWTLRTALTSSNSPGANLQVERDTFMVALQKVDAIFIRGTHYESLLEAVISDVILDTAIPIQGHPTPLATSVEVCSCPREYNSTSCQDAAVGYFIPHYRVTDISDTMLSTLIGKAEICQCNGRSETCNKDTGYCTNCRENTGGQFCNRCAEGHYGDVGSRGGCQACPCPHSARNFATSCTIRPGRVTCNCKDGYTGPDCSVCAPGWWLGNDGQCRLCECDGGGVIRDRTGAVPQCHPTTGQCPCMSHVTGMHCDLCLTPRHYLEEHLCLPCDNCTQTLLDTIELMEYEFIQDTVHIKNTSIPKPWIALYRLSNKTVDMKQKLSEIKSAVEKIQSLPESAFTNLLSRVEVLNYDTSAMNRVWNETSTSAYKLKNDVNLIFNKLMKKRKKLENIIRELEDFSRNERHVNVGKALKDARGMLRIIKKFDLSEYTDIATNVFDEATLLSAKIYEYIYKLKNHQNKIQYLKKSLETLNNNTDNINKFKDNTWVIIDRTEDSIKRYRDRYNINVLERNVQSEAILGDINVLKNHTLNQEATVILQECEDDIYNLKLFRPYLENLYNHAESKEGILYRINPEYKEIYLIPAERHADNLTNLASSYKDLFTATKDSSNSAVNASSAYKNIVEGIEMARDAAKDALQIVRYAEQIATGHKPVPDSNIQGVLIDLANRSKTHSEKLLHQAKKQNHRVKDMLTDLEKSRLKVDRIKMSIRTIASDDKRLSGITNNLGNINVDESLAIANNKSDKVDKNMRALSSEADQIYKDILYKLKMKFNDLQSHGDDKIGGAEEKVSLLRGNIRRASQLASSLMDAVQLRNAEVARFNYTLAQKFQLLRDQIQRAKHAADGIHISMRSSPEGGCYRSYRLSNLSPSTTTQITAVIAISPENTKDSVLFHLPSTANSDFIKLEMVNRKIRFSWNVGGDTAYITHPEILETFSSHNLDYSWYRVDADRVWNMGKLRVYKVISDSENLSPNVPASNSSSPHWGTLDVKPEDLVWIGSIGDQHQKGNGLSGILHRLSYNGKKVGLWNFNSQPESKGCAGYIEGPDETNTNLQNMFYWNGAGYSVLKRSHYRLYNRNQFSILLTFRTFDENALLFLAVDEANNRSVSLQLREGRVVFRIDYAGESRLEINTTEKYNTGKFVQVSAARDFTKKKIDKGSLRVDGYEQLGSPNPPVTLSSAVPDLTHSTYFVGGTPPLWKPSSIVQSLPPPFMGCLGDLTIDQEGYNPLDASVHYGIESSCSEKLYSTVGFYGDGYLELPAHTLRKKSQLGLMFRTLQPNAFLLLSAPQHYHTMRTNEVIPEYSYTTEHEFVENIPSINEGFYSLSLVEGKIHLLMNAGKGDLKLVSNASSLNDGIFHALSIIKFGRKVELYVDDVLQSSGTLPPGSVVVHAIPQPADGSGGGGWFLGGVPEQLNETDVTNQHIASTVSLHGAIKEIVFDGSIIYLNEMTSMNRALTGRLGPPMGEENEAGANLLNTQQIDSNANKTSKGCHKVYSYTLEPGAVKFGDVSNSYAQVHLTGRNIWQRDFILEFDFRTFYPNGLLFMTPSSKERQPHFIAVFLRDGKVTLSIKAKKKREMSIPLVTNDGTWHHVTVRSAQRRLSVTVGPRIEKARMPRKLFLNNMLYVGGLPDKSTLLMIPEQMAKLEGFKGCIRRLTINGKLEDLVKDVALHKNVGQCFPTIERGSYFQGDAYAIYKRQFVIESHLELELEFKTVIMNGILLSIAHTNINSPKLSLEILNGKVVMSVFIGGRRFRVETSLPTQFGLCDNTWHNISALFSTGELTIRVDQERQVTFVDDKDLGNSYMTPPSINQPSLYTPLYIGGLPDGAPTGTLTTKDNFKGCIRNVSIRGRRKDWTDMDYLHNLLLSSCPVQ